jgi:hypothetical protein
MSQEAVLGVRPSTNSPDPRSIDPREGLSNTKNLVDPPKSLQTGQAAAQAGAIEADKAEPCRMSSSDTSISCMPNARIT